MTAIEHAGVGRNHEHDELRSVARRFLEGQYTSERIRLLSAADDDLDTAAWQQMAGLGWAGISVPEAYGGAGYGMAERGLLLEEMGRVLTPGPFLSSAVLAADLIEHAGSDESRRALLPALADGSVRAAAVAAGDLAAGSDPYGQVRATRTSDGDWDGWSMTGPGGLAFDAATADLLVVVARVDGDDRAARRGGGSGVGLFAVDAGADGVDRRPVALVDRTRKVADTCFAGAPARRLDDGDGGVDGVGTLVRGALARGAVSLAAEMVGGAQRCLDMTLAYVKDRQQFGRPIGSFQAVKHRCADLALLVVTARHAVELALEVIDTGQEAHVTSVTAAAKIAANDAYLQATLEMIQLHGGIGYTWEHDAHLFYKRALVSNQALGSSVDHRVRLAEALHV